MNKVTPLLSRLSRVTSGGRQFLPQVDGLRFIAIMLVLAFHVAGYTTEKTGRLNSEEACGLFTTLLSRGHIGVQLFFVISGFILAMPFARHRLLGEKRPGLRAYFVRRLTRLEPPYLVHVFMLFLITLTVGKYVITSPGVSSQIHDPGWIIRAFIAHVTYTNQLILHTTPQLNVVLWSLEIEVQFYVLAPLLTTIFAVHNAAFRRAALCVGIGLCSCSAWWGLRNSCFMITNTLAGFLQYFLVGFLLVDLYLTRWGDRLPGQFIWDLLSAVGWAGILCGGMAGQLDAVVLPWAILLAYVAAFRGVILRKFLCNPWIVTIGGMCYTIYMYHYWMISALGRLTIKLQTGVLWLDILVQLGILLSLILPVCAILFALFERPFMQRDWHKKLWARLFTTPKVVIMPEREGAAEEARKE